MSRKEIRYERVKENEETSEIKKWWKRKVVRKVQINNKKVTLAKIDDIATKAVENIVIAGFDNALQLERLVRVNSSNTPELWDTIMVKLVEAYTDQFLKEFEKHRSQIVSQTNSVAIVDKLNIVLFLARRSAKENLPYTPFDEDKNDDYEITEEENKKLKEVEDEAVEAKERQIIANLSKA